MNIAVCGFLLIVTGAICSNAAISVDGLEKLGDVEKKYPNLLARATIKKGDWIEVRTRARVVPKGIVESSAERSIAQVAKQIFITERREVVNVLEAELVIRVTRTAGGESFSTSEVEDVCPRSLAFSRANLAKMAERTISRDQGIIDSFRINEATLEDSVPLEVKGRTLSCKKVSVDMTLNVRTLPSSERFVVRNRITEYQHESLPIDGSVKFVSDVWMDVDGEEVQMSTTQEAIDYGSPSAQAIAPESRMTAQTQSGEADLPYELVPLKKALETGRISGQVANNLSIGQIVHQDTMRNRIDDIEARRKLHQTKDSFRETLDVLLREVEEVRNVATAQLLVFDKKSGNIMLISKVYTDRLEKGLSEYGVVLPSLNWGYMPPFAREASKADWEGAKTARIKTGRWAGAYLLEGKQVLLPGFRALDKLSNPAAPDSVR